MDRYVAVVDMLFIIAVAQFGAILDGFCKYPDRSYLHVVKLQIPSQIPGGSVEDYEKLFSDNIDSIEKFITEDQHTLFVTFGVKPFTSSSLLLFDRPLQPEMKVRISQMLLVCLCAFATHFVRCSCSTPVPILHIAANSA